MKTHPFLTFVFRNFKCKQANCVIKLGRAQSLNDFHTIASKDMKLKDEERSGFHSLQLCGEEDEKGSSLASVASEGSGACIVSRTLTISFQISQFSEK